MPKIRTHKSTQRRFKVTGSGKVMRRKAMRSHLLEKKSAKRKRAYRSEHTLSASDVKRVVRIAPYM